MSAKVFWNLGNEQFYFFVVAYCKKVDAFVCFFNKLSLGKMEGCYRKPWAQCHYIGLG